MFDCTCMDKYGNTVTHLTQWDFNQTLYIEDHGFTITPLFHFCNKNSETAYNMPAKIDANGILMVEIPNILLTEPYNITAYVFLAENKSGRTVEVINLPVRPRPKPDDFEYENNHDVTILSELAEEMRLLIAGFTENENERIAAETIRISNENTRISEETKRINAENNRVIAENIRLTSETERVENERLRVSAESTRVTAEDIRKSNENLRVSAELQRKSSEETRVENEAIRQQQEEIRQNIILYSFTPIN